MMRVMSGLVLFGALAGAAVLAGCEEDFRTTDKTTRVRLGGKPFTLDLALDSETRIKGLSGRASIPEDGGMLFVFPDSQVQRQEFVMRDCPTTIDIIFLDRSRRVTASHAMLVEAPRKPEEDLRQYEDRLKRYSSRFDAQYAIELKGGTLEKLTVKPGELIEVDPGLVARAK